MISIANGNRLDFRYVCATHYKYFLLQKRDLSSAFPLNVLKLRKTLLKVRSELSNFEKSVESRDTWTMASK